ncbi:hypothetical protein HBH70_067820 [Parastagonospora nodorum]|nr:hypothetical protein HBI95_205310 [Parastagonospora nodorum]KAH4917145.1 hypothetical protein HBI79_222040 [Parastagonospora nodorum]KAH5053622.1 hypothetical protein HBH96_149180 [Parastagonospora nodorum]KAH5142786.1 hypothetical protein HBH70_067820 [Parastagonospora nodorum]KAH5165573.1 hypothetical protein HBI73_027840 [Parastagonospora nodorum]
MLPLLFAIPLIVAQQRHAIQRALWDHDLETLALVQQRVTLLRTAAAGRGNRVASPRLLRPCCLGTRLLSLRQHQQTSVLLPTPASSPSLEHTLHRL